MTNHEQIELGSQVKDTILEVREEDAPGSESKSLSICDHAAEIRDKPIDKVDEVFLQYGKRALALLIDYFVAGLSSLGFVFIIPPLLFSFDLFWTGAGGSPGKKHLSLRVTDVHGRQLSDKRILLRSTLKLAVLSSAICGCFFAHSPLWLILLVTYQRRTVYDWIAGSYIRGKELNPQTAFCPRPNYLLFLTFVGVIVAASYLRFSVGHRILSIVEPIIPGILTPVRRTLASMELHLINLDKGDRRDFNRIDRLADLQQVIAPPGDLSPARLSTLLRGYEIATETQSSSLMKKYAEQIADYSHAQIANAVMANPSWVYDDQEEIMLKIYSDSGDVKEGSAILERLTQRKSYQDTQERFTNNLINYLYRGVKWRPDAVRLRWQEIDRFVETDYREHWNYCKETCTQQVYDLFALGRNAEAEKLDREIKQMEKKLRAEHEREKMRAL